MSTPPSHRPDPMLLATRLGRLRPTHGLDDLDIRPARLVDRDPQHRDHRAHRRGQDHDDRAHPVLLGRRSRASARSTRAPRSPTGWSRSRSAASASPPPRRRLAGGPRRQPDRHAGPRRLHDRGRALAARPRRRDRRVRRRSRASSRRARRSGARPIATACRGSRSSTSAIAPAPIPRGRSPSCATRLGAQADRDPAAARPRRELRRRDRSRSRCARARGTTTSVRRDVHRRADPARAADAASRAREQMIEAIAEHDDELMAAWVSGRERRPTVIRDALRRVTLAGRGVPDAGRCRVPQPGHSQPARRGARLLAVARRLHRGPRSRPARSRRRPCRCRDALLTTSKAARRARVQGPERRSGRTAHVRARLRRLSPRRRRRAQRDQGPPRADWPAGSDVREPPRGHPPDRGRHASALTSNMVCLRPATRCATPRRRPLDGDYRPEPR